MLLDPFTQRGLTLRNRIVVLLEWFRSYWTYQRSARIIVGDGED